LINLIQFAHAETASEASSGGISSLGINGKAFLFQLITFVIVLLILRRWVFPKLVATLEERRKVLEESLEQAKQTEETLRKTQSSTAEILSKAREQADAALSDAQSRAKEIIAEAEKSGEEAASRIIKEAEQHLGQERAKLRDELKEELAELVVTTTEKVIGKRLNSHEDMGLIKDSIQELKK
jgi:F-type H+-transporting ATPase subunit b